MTIEDIVGFLQETEKGLPVFVSIDGGSPQPVIMVCPQVYIKDLTKYPPEGYVAIVLEAETIGGTNE